MKQVLFRAINLFCLVFTLSAMADQSNWAFVRKSAGPPSWTCPENVTLDKGKTDLRVDWPPMSALRFENINRGISCSELNSSNILTGVRCQQSNTLETRDSVTYERRDCTALGPFASDCNPEEKDPSISLWIEKDSYLILTRNINWVDYPYLTCEYFISK